MTLDIDTALAWRGRPVHDRDGTKLGTLGALYLDGDDRPAYGGIKTGLFGRNESIVPLANVREGADGVLELPFGSDDVAAAPKLDPDAALTPEEEDALLAHYGTASAEDAAPTGADPAGSAANAGAEGAAPAMTRSEEEVEVRAGAMQPAERVRLRKVLVTEHVKTTVPRRREVIRLETEPAPEGTIERVEDLPPE